jgi:tetratricopeptide (TPR) repeat protein
MIDRMVRIVMVVVVALGLVPVTALAQTSAREGVLAAAKAYDEGQYDVSIALLTKAIGSGELTGDQLGEAHWNRGVAFERAGDKAKALADIDVFASMFPGDSDGPSKLADLAVQLHRYAEAAKALGVIFEKFPARIRERKFEVVEVARDMQLNGQWDQAENLLGRYGTIDYEDPTISLSRARTAAVLGRKGEAIDLLRRSASQHNLALARADKAFAALWDDPDFASTADIAALYERDLAQAITAARTDPDSLFPIVLQMSALWRLGRFDAAIALGREALASDLARFKDIDYREAQLHEQLARALEAKGDVAGAERAFRTGVDRLSDKSETVVTLLMSAGQFLASTEGKYRDALDYADRANKFALLIYGTKIGDSVRALAYWGLNDQTALNGILAQVAAHPAESQSIAVDLDLLTGRLDAAARLVASQLADPARVDTTLVALQRYTKNRPAVGLVEKTIEAGWDALRKDPAVLAAVAKVGRITDIPAANRF